MGFQHRFDFLNPKDKAQKEVKEEFSVTPLDLQYAERLIWVYFFVQ